MTRKKQSRHGLTIAAMMIIASAMVYAFWPQPMLVDIGEVTRGPMMLTINEVARTRVRDTFVVSAPVSGRLLRVEKEPGDRVEQGRSVVARMLPSSPPTLDAREREQARTRVQAAQAALRAARSDLNTAEINLSLADTAIKRATEQRNIGTISESEFEQARREANAARSSLENSAAALAMREAELANAQAAFINSSQTQDESQEAIAIRAPIDGRILRVMQESELVLSVGAPILEIGDVDNGLEVLVELLSTDAVQIQTGDRVIIENWGGAAPLAGIVQRIDPFGVTRFSALGVEEQRVNAIVQFSNPVSERAGLGHGYRVEVQIVVWESDDALIVPASALFRHDGDWAVYLVDNGSARLQTVEIDQNNGIEANLLNGLAEGDPVVLYPAAELTDGTAIANRQDSN
jgi:HlyD family secretion protein